MSRAAGPDRVELHPNVIRPAPVPMPWRMATWPGLAAVASVAALVAAQVATGR